MRSRSGAPDTPNIAIFDAAGAPCAVTHATHVRVPNNRAASRSPPDAIPNDNLPRLETNETDLDSPASKAAAGFDAAPLGRINPARRLHSAPYPHRSSRPVQPSPVAGTHQPELGVCPGGRIACSIFEDMQMASKV